LNDLKFASVLFHRSMKSVVLGGTLGSLAVGIYLAGSGNAGVLAAAAPRVMDAVDQSALITARLLAGQAHGADEQEKAAAALQVADHAVDQAFGTALREAAAGTPPLQGEALATSQKIAALQATVEEEKQHVVILNTARIKTASQVDVAGLAEQAQAQLEFDANRLSELQRELVLLGGDKQARIQQALDEHDAQQEQPIVNSTAAKDLESSQNLVTLPGKVRAFLEMRAREKHLRQAGEDATTAAARLTQQRKAIEKRSSPDSGGQQQATVECDAGIQDQQQLAAIYGSWAALTRAKRVIVQHGILQALAILIAIFLAVSFGAVLIRRELAGRVKERRRIGRYPVIAGLVVEALALAMILIVIFGTPIQMPMAPGL
jgi:hypothetical protein